MHYLLAPSKTMTMTRPYPRSLTRTEPIFNTDARRIVDVICAEPDIAALMHVSDAIATRVKHMYQTWGEHTEPALFAYIGDVYKWFYADTLSVDAIEWAQQHFFIMSGLYGALRPLDTVSLYRLEMKAKISVRDAKDLYDFWGSRIARYVDGQSDGVLCNLSSEEYSKVVTKYTKARVITPVFMDNKVNGSVGTVPIYSKMMRGVMARWIIDHRIDTVEGLRDFTAQGYAYTAGLSTDDTPVFYRQVPKPIRF